MKHLTTTTINKIKYALFIVSLFPFAKLILAFFNHTFGPDPVADITHVTGLWALNFLIATLLISPLRKLTHWNWLMRLRRTIAMFGFFYASLHVLAYSLFDHSFDLSDIGKDIARHPYMLAGLISFGLMIPLALTSTTGMIKRMGGRYWQLLHRLAYPAAAAAVVHYFWLVKRDVTDPSIYAIILLILFCARLTKSKPHLHSVERLKNLKEINSAWNTSINIVMTCLPPL